VDGRAFGLPPRLVRSHTLCRPGTRVVFELPGRAREPTRQVSFEVSADTRLAVVTTEEGALTVRRE
jgi:hypothetical protein